MNNNCLLLIIGNWKQKIVILQFYNILSNKNMLFYVSAFGPERQYLGYFMFSSIHRLKCEILA